MHDGRDWVEGVNTGGRTLPSHANFLYSAQLSETWITVYQKAVPELEVVTCSDKHQS